MASEQGRRIPVITIDFETRYIQRFENDEEPIPCVGDTLILLSFQW
jgi:hypothetical protein